MSDFRFLIDTSGSTSGCSAYWAAVLTRANQAVNVHGARVTFYFWNTNLQQVTYQAVMQQCKKRLGTSGTDPSCFAHSSVLPQNCNIILFSDGQVL